MCQEMLDAFSRAAQLVLTGRSLPVVGRATAMDVAVQAAMASDAERTWKNLTSV